MKGRCPGPLDDGDVCATGVPKRGSTRRTGFLAQARSLRRSPHLGWTLISEWLEFLDGGAGVPQHIHEDLVQPLDDGIVAPAGFT